LWEAKQKVHATKDFFSALNPVNFFLSTALGRDEAVPYQTIW
jgi:hypothetical protein